MQATHAMHATYSYRSSATISGTTPTHRQALVVCTGVGGITSCLQWSNYLNYFKITDMLTLSGLFQLHNTVK